MQLTSQIALRSHDLNGTPVQQRESDGYINATQLCKAAGKFLADYRRIKETQELLLELSTSMGIPIDVLVEVTTSGANELRGTWVHPDVAIHLAQWLSPRFTMQVIKWVKELMTTGKVDIRPDVDPIVAALEQARDVRLRQIEHEKRLTKVEARADEAHQLAEAAMRTAEGNEGWVSVLGYCRQTGRSFPREELAKFGKRLSAKMRSLQLTPGKAPHPHLGMVNTYPVELLQEFFKDAICK